MDQTIGIIAMGAIAAFAVLSLRRRSRNGETPKGTSEDWYKFGLIMIGLMLFLFWLISITRGL